MYFLLTTAQGDTHVQSFNSKEDLLKYMDPQTFQSKFLGPEDLAKLGTQEIAWWGRANLLIKGEIVQPKTKVIEFTVD